jgi:NADH-quinone oxidoreductase subunit G
MKITVDDNVLEVAEGRTILQALDDAGLLMNGIDIPHYCWHPKLTVDGSCRLCQVEIEGLPKLQIACNTPVRDGMVVRTNTEQVKSAREGVMELLLVNHPLDCPICDQAGECKLQDYTYDYGAIASRTREPRRALKKNVALGPGVVFDQERCILCRRCVRFCREVSETRELGVFNRGDASVVDTFPETPLDNPYSMNVADLCPVGALTTRDFRFKVRAWFLEELDGICTGCARGCNVTIGVTKNEVQRYVPRRNDEVNDTWICDAGRLSYHQIGSPGRLKRSLVRGSEGNLVPADFDAAVAEAANRLRSLVESKGSGVVAGIASAHATNEDLYIFRRFLDALGSETRGVAVILGDSDEVLIKAEKAANATGARALGFGDAALVVDRIRSGGVEAVVVLGHDILDERYLGGDRDLATLDTVIALDLHQSELQRVAHVVFPTLHAAEKHGTLTNFAGRVQRVAPVVTPAWEARAEGEVLARIGAALGLEGFDGSYDPRATSRELAQREPAFAGAHLGAVGRGGQVPSEAAPPPEPEGAT